jgi:hypothetical protein
MSGNKYPFRVVATYRNGSVQTQQTYNAENLGLAWWKANEECKKRNCVKVEISTIICTLGRTSPQD